MKEFSASTTIHASPETIWRILTDAPNYPAWDPWVIRIEGSIAPGQRIVAYNKINPNRAFPARVSAFQARQRMTWTGGMPLGLFTGTRTFALVPRADDKSAVDFTLREVYSGLLLPLFAGSIPDLTQSFADFVKGLKQYAERQ